MKARASARSASRSARSSRAAGVDLDDDRAVESAGGELLEQLGARLVAAAGHQVLVAGRLPMPSAMCTWREPVAHRVGHRQRVGLRHRGVRQVEGEVAVVLVDRVPVRRVRRHLAAARAQREHVLHREAHVGLARPSAAMPATNSRAYSRCQRNGGCTTTVCAPSTSAASGPHAAWPTGRCPTPAA